MARGGRRPGAGRPTKRKKRAPDPSYCLHAAMTSAWYISVDDPLRMAKRAVTALVALGASHGEVAGVFELDEPTLRHLYRWELDLGAFHFKFALRSTLNARALGRGGHRSSVTALIYMIRNMDRIDADIARSCSLGLACDHIGAAAQKEKP